MDEANPHYNIIEGNLLFSNSSDLKVNCIQNHPHRSIHSNLDHASSPHGSAKFTCKISRHTIKIKANNKHESQIINRKNYFRGKSRNNEIVGEYMS